MAISKISANGIEHELEATRLVTPILIDGIEFNGENTVSHYGMCYSSAGDVEKVAGLMDKDDNSLSDTLVIGIGSRVTIKFAAANTATAPTLKIGQNTAKPIKWHGSTIPASQYWETGAVIDFVCTGGSWELVGIAKDNNTTYSAAGTSLGLVKSGGDVAISNGIITVNDDSHNHTIANVDNLQTSLDSKLGKTTYEYNKELAIGSTGKVCIGKFPMYDSNISVEIKSTTSTTYNGTLVIATQNINTTGGGSYTATVYGDASNSLTDAIKIQYLSGSNVFSVYVNLPSWSKNLLHIQCVALAGTPTDIATTVTEVPSTATIVPTNALKAQLDAKQATITGGASTITGSNLTSNRVLISNSSGKVAVSAVTSTELGYLDGVTSAIQTQLNAKAPLASPALTGNPTAPTQAAGNNSTRIATTAFVTTAITNAIGTAIAASY